MYPQTLPEMLALSASRYKNNMALHEIKGDSLTYAMLQKQVENTALFLKEKGVEQGDTICLLSENSLSWVIAYFSIVTLGAVAVPILPDFHTHTITHIINDCRAKCLFVSKKLTEKVAIEMFQDSVQVIPLESLATITRREQKEGDTLCNSTDQTSAVTHGNNTNFFEKQASAVHEDDLASIIYTSGTTGQPKGVMLSHKNIIFDALAVDHIETVTCDDRFLSLLPLSHVYEFTLGLILPLIKGAQVFYLGSLPTPKILLSAVEAVKPTVMLSVPLIIEKIYKNNILPKLLQNTWKKFLLRLPLFSTLLIRMAGKKLVQAFGGCLRALIIGGAPLNIEVERFLFRAKFPYIIGYGLTETSSLVSATTLKNPRLRTSGRTVEGIQIRIERTTNHEDIGEIQVKGNNVTQGYYKQPELTKEIFTPDGWFKTGDLGFLDDEGFLHIKGRSKNMLLGASGENIYPEEIESLLLSSPYVLEALVCMVKEKLSAKVYLDATKIDALWEADKRLSKEVLKKNILEEIRKSANEHVSSFAKVIYIFEQKEPFERTPTQKIRRHLYVDGESR